MAVGATATSAYAFETAQAQVITNPASKTITVGSSFTVKAIDKTEANHQAALGTPTITWASSKTSVATVTSAGKVTAFTNSGVTYKVVSDRSVYVQRISSSSKRKASTLSIRASVPYKGRGYTVIGIKSKALKGTRARTLKVCTTSLTKARVKGSLSGSRVRTVYAYPSVKSTYRSCFVKSNSGRSVSVRGF
ncbi:MAG: hypothetical protein PUA57_00100 [Eggerthellales bacterium]|nr:hypothetical protein [Eggerthellales bacterium]